MKRIPPQSFLRATVVGLVVAVAGIAWTPAFSWRSEWQADRNYTVQSDTFDVVWYCGSGRTLTVVFDDGSIYEYYRVSSRDWRDFMTTRHKGGFFNGRIRDRYDYQRLR